MVGKHSVSCIKIYSARSKPFASTFVRSENNGFTMKNTVSHIFVIPLNQMPITLKSWAHPIQLCRNIKFCVFYLFIVFPSFK